ncbi:MAG: secretin N-terminal domain-containing protein [Candidatus Hydrogenedentales bacterium]|jgi:type II secretory pathway component GspD/PulD (secretin)
MTVFLTRPITVILLSIFSCVAAISAVAQGQTPTSPQDTPSTSSPRVRPSPSSGIPWDGDDGSSSRRIDRSQSSGTSSRRGASTGTTTGGATGTGTTGTTGGTTAGGTRTGSSGVSTPSTAGGSAAQRAAADGGPGKEPPTPRDSGGGPRVVGGSAHGGGGSAVGASGAPSLGGGGGAYSRGGVSAISSSGAGGFEPILKREPGYKPVPEDGEKLTLEGPMPLDEFLTAINLATNWNILVSPQLQGIELRFWIYDVSPKQALEVLKFNKVYYEYDEENQFLQVMTRDEYLIEQFGKVKPHEFHITNADIGYMESLVNTLLSSSGKIITDPRTNNIYVWDTEDNIEEMTRLIKDMDVPLKKTEFTIKYAEVADIEAMLSTFLSGSGSVLSDVRTGQIFVWDSPAILDQMREAVARLDQPVESKTFEIVHVSAEDVVDSIESLLTERGMIQVDPRFNTVMVTDLPTRLENITKVIETLDRQLDTRTWIVKYADLDFIADQIEAYIPGEMGQIIVQDEVHQLTVSGLPSRLDEIDKLIQEWDIKRRQVLIEAHIVEVSTDVERAFNVNWSAFSNVGGSPFAIHDGSGSTGVAEASGSGQIAGGGGVPYAVPRYGALQLNESGAITRPLLKDINGQTVIDRYMGRNIAVTLDYLDRQEKATVLSSPRVTVQDGEEAVFENATKVPYVSSTGYGYGGYYGGYAGSNVNDDNYRRYNSGNSRVEFIDVGTILSVLPRITADDNILLDISAEDSTYTDKNVVVDDLTRSVPEKTIRQADTQVRVNSGDTIVLGGLRRDRAGHSTSRTPILGDIPLVGKLFNNPKRSSKNAALLIFITTTIVDESTMPESAQIAHVDQELSDARRRMQKKPLDRLKTSVNDNKDEIGVSIGQSGSLFSDGEIVTVEELKERFFDAKDKQRVTVVIRKHPSAPVDTINAVMECAMEAGLRIEFDNDIPPIVPAIQVGS